MRCSGVASPKPVDVNVTLRPLGWICGPGVHVRERPRLVQGSARITLLVVILTSY
jgi:hypothetical protein